MTTRIVNRRHGMWTAAVRIPRAALACTRAPAVGDAKCAFFSRIARHRQLIFSYVRAPAGLSAARTAAR